MEVVIGALVLLSIVLFVITVRQGKTIKRLERVKGALHSAYDSQTRMLHKANVELLECRNQQSLNLLLKVDESKITNVPGAY